jgi:hypothetical protein
MNAYVIMRQSFFFKFVPLDEFTRSHNSFKWCDDIKEKLDN